MGMDCPHFADKVQRDVMACLSSRRREVMKLDVNPGSLVQLVWGYPFGYGDICETVREHTLEMTEG